MPMSDDELFGSAPAAAPPADPGDPAIWTVLGETGGDPQGQKAVASVIANRAKHTSSAAADVVEDPAQGFEAWAPAKRAALQKQYPPGSPEYQAAKANVLGILTGKEPAPFDYDTFYSPTAQKALGRNAPAWEDGSGADVAGNRFFSGKYQAAPILSDADQEAWRALQGNRPVEIASTAKTPDPGLPASSQADTAKFLALHGFFDRTATPGSPELPLMETADSGAPTRPGTWYIPRQGGLRQVGSDVPDYLPHYRALAATREDARSAPIPQRLAAGFGQGVNDVGGSINKLLGGSLGASPEGAMVNSLMGSGADYTGPVDQAAAQGYEHSRDEFNLVHGGDPAATTGRVGGNIVASAPLMAYGDAAGGALGAGLIRAAPEVAPAATFLAGKTGGNMLLRAPSLATRGAIQGTEAAGLTSAASDRPLENQLLHAAKAGAVLGVGVPAVLGAGSALMASHGGAVAPEVANLADVALNKYGIPLRRTQLLGTADRNAAIHDSEMISQAGTGYAENHAAQHQAFTRAVAGTFGADADKLTPEVMSQAKNRIGGEFERVAQNTTITDTNHMQSELDRVLSDAQQVLPDSDAAPLAKQVENIKSAIKGGVLSGDSYQALTRNNSPLDRATESANSNIRHYAQELKGVLDDALTGAATPEDAQALGQAKWQYKNLMTVKNLAAKANVSGEISPTLLNGAVNTSFKNRAFTGAGDLGELAQIGQTFMKEPPNSGTAPRLADFLKRNLLIGGGLGAGEGLALFNHDPGLAMKAAGGAAALGALRYGANAASGAFNRSPGVVNSLIRRGQQQVSAPAYAGTALDLLRPAYVPVGVDTERNKLFALPSS